MRALFLPDRQKRDWLSYTCQHKFVLRRSGTELGGFRTGLRAAPHLRGWEPSPNPPKLHPEDIQEARAPALAPQGVLFAFERMVEERRQLRLCAAWFL